LEPRTLFSAEIAGVFAADLTYPAAEVQTWDGYAASTAAQVDTPRIVMHPVAAARPAAALENSEDSGEPERLDLIVLDPTVPEGERLLADLLAHAGAGRRFEILRLDADRDGIEQITIALANRATPLDALHVLSHGTAGGIKLGNAWLAQDTLARYEASIASWQASFAAGADLLIYGCDVAADAGGQALIAALHALTGADIGASVDPTGAADLGGDWALEHVLGRVAQEGILRADDAWSGLLASLTVGTTADVLDGNTTSIANLIAGPGADGQISLREAIIAANSTAGADTIILSSGTYVLSLAGSGENSAVTGDLDILGDLTLTGAGANATFIDAAGLDRVFDVRAGNVSMTGVTLRGGSATGDGGGVSVLGGATLTLRDTAISQNTVSGDGGGLAIAGTATLERVTIDGNAAASGGGIYVAPAGAATLLNVTVSGNSATVSGGGIRTWAAMSIASSTIAYNTAPIGGGFCIDGGAVVSLENSILAFNGGGNADAPITSLGHNIDSESSAGMGGPGDFVNTDPLLSALQYNSGGTIRTHALLAGSPAIDAGTNAGASSVDARGYQRIDGRSDIGAIEANASALSKIYWVDQSSNKVKRANLDGSGVEEVLTGINSPTDIVVDAVGGKIYWTENSAGRIKRANLDGSGIQTLYTGLSAPAGLALDRANSRLYWVENPLLLGSNRIRSASMNGGGAIQNLVTSGTADPIDLQLDLEGGKIYWTDAAAGQIRRANLDGSGAGTFITGLTSPQSLRLDVNTRTLYWTSDGLLIFADKIQRANLDGAVVVEDLVTAGLSALTGIELDLANGRLYWADSGTGRIQSANLDGSNVQTVISSLLTMPIGLTLGTGVDVNDAPVLAGTNALVGILEDAASNNGTLVSALIAAQIGDADASAVSGIAVTAVDNTDGTWQYTTNGGTNWNNFGTPGVATARLLAADTQSAVRFVPNANWYGTVAAGITFRAWDRTSGIAGATADTSVNGGTSAYSTATANASVVVTSVNDAPTGADNTISTNEDVAYILGISDFGFTDPADMPSNDISAVRIVTLPGAGSLTNNGIAVSAGQSVSAADIAAGRLVFTPAQHAHGAGYASFTFQVIDNGGTANGGLDIDPAPNTIIFNVDPVNDAPGNTLPVAQATPFNTALILSAGNRIRIADIDAAASNVQVTLTGTNGTLTLAGFAGLAFTVGDGSDDAIMTFTGTLADVNAALDGLTFTPTPAYAGPASIAIDVDDLGNSGAGGPAGDSDTLAVTVYASTTLTVTNDTRTAPENGSVYLPTVLGNDSDPALGTLSVTAVNGNAAAIGNTIVLPSGALLHMNGDGTFDYDSNGIFNGLGQGATGIDSFLYEVTSTSTAVGSGTVTITVDGQNTAPGLAGANALVDILEDAASNNGTLVSALIAGQVSDTDTSALAGIAVTAVDNTDGTWQYTTDGGSNWMSFGAPDATAARLLAADALSAVRFVPNAHWYGTVGAGITIRAWDRSTGVAGSTADTSINGGASAYSTATASASVVVTSVNDAPAGADKTIAANEDVAYIFSATDFGFSDAADSPANALEAVRIVTLPGAGILTNNGIAVSAGQTVSVGDITTGRLVFTSAPNASGAGYASFTFQIADNGGTTNGGVDLDPSPHAITVDVNPVNDAPTLTSISGVAAATPEDAEATITFAGLLALADDGDIDGSVNAFVVTAITSGTLRIGASAATATPWAAGANEVIDATRCAYWTPAGDAYGVLSAFTVVARDSQGADSSIAVTVAVSVSPVADAPVATHATTIPDTPTSSGLVISVNAADGAEVTHFEITGIAAGTLYQNDGTTAITEGDFITVAQGSAGLRFTPLPGSTAPGRFTVRASLSASAAGLGSGFATATITVTPAATTAPATASPDATPGAVANEDQTRVPPIDAHETPRAGATMSDPGVGALSAPPSTIETALPAAAAPAPLPTSRSTITDDAEFATPSSVAIAANTASDQVFAPASDPSGAADGTTRGRVIQGVVAGPSPGQANPGIPSGQDRAVMDSESAARPDQTAEALASTAWREELDRLREDAHAQAAVEHRIAGATVAVTSSLSAGYVLWLVRGGVLMSSLLTSLPAWRALDPLPILARKDRREDEDEESLETIVGDTARKPPEVAGDKTLPEQPQDESRMTHAQRDPEQARSS